jgi:hypothetical protein
LAVFICRSYATIPTAFCAQSGESDALLSQIRDGVRLIVAALDAAQVTGAQVGRIWEM